ncbi:MAG: hypothetical protein ABA06_01440 [Parcubacteria bacterium C7867-001]|nr:MAG: hypothetical protein ABA06_01440 [Parcubacteria bacterium C7867-001]
MQPLLLFITALPLGLALDFLWIGVIAKGFYREQYGDLLASSFKIGPALLFYVFFVVGLIVFVLQPAIASHSLLKAVALGAFLGFIAYMTYDLTNMATLVRYPLFLAVVDIAWGTIAWSIVSGATYLVATRFFGM